ncbi:Mitogen-activated protein kinase-like protein D5 [Hibiscus syriacus]|uniref:Mitogen-activated protein kinase-like protein D5 n=1 Tax=Hibiscus syriacus TaxID=106335 RepID=A0A6A3CLK9_HIBSY|nr:Mitogen-activated protein kinase-like protein D5 [Hibiscus syriacus]
MAECKRMKGDGTQSGSVKKDVRSKWNSMSDAEKEPYITQSRNDSKEYKERRKAHENKEKGQLNVLGEIGFGSLIGVRDRPIRRELCRSLMAQFDVSQCMAKYGDYSFPLGVSTAAAVLGVQNKGKSVIEVCRSKNWKALASKYGLNHKVTYAEVEEDIKSGSYWGDELKARVLLYLVGIFLCPTRDTSTNKEYMKLICDEGLKGEFNWAEYIHSRLIESIITFKKGSQRYLKGCIAILEVALFDFWSGCEAVPAYERTGVARIRAWGKEEVVRVMVKLKLDRGKKQEMVIGKDVEEAVEAEEKKGGMVVLGDDGEWDDSEGKQSNFDILMSELADIKKIQFEIMQRQSRVEEKLDRVVEKLERVEDTLERHKGVVEGKIDGVVKEVEVLRGEVVKEVGGVVDKYSDEGAQLKGEIKEMKSYVEKKYDELKKYEEEKREEEEEEMEEMRRKEVDVIYTPESVIAAVLDSECPAPQKKKQKVEKADIPSGIDDIEAAICDYLWNSELESGWYRAPELLLNSSDYNAAINVWSVGCIFMELMDRKPLFPGGDHVHQLRFLMELVGTPSEAEMDFLNEKAKRYIHQLPVHRRQTLTEKFPNVNPLAVDLVEKMLTFDPRQRITVEHALVHPYLTSLHDTSDESFCTTPFDFDFEQYALTEEQMKELIYQEAVAFNPEYLKTPMTVSIPGEVPEYELNPVEFRIWRSDGIWTLRTAMHLPYFLLEMCFNSYERKKYRDLRCYLRNDWHENWQLKVKPDLLCSPWWVSCDTSYNKETRKGESRGKTHGNKCHAPDEKLGIDGHELGIEDQRIGKLKKELGILNYERGKRRRNDLPGGVKNEEESELPHIKHLG